MRITQISGGVGGARMARGLAALPDVELTVVVNIGDDESVHGLWVSPDLDTVVYTLAGVEGPRGWGRSDDSFVVHTELERFGVDEPFRLGDRDLALNILRTREVGRGVPLSEVTARAARALGVEAAVLPASDDPAPTRLRVGDGWISFQDYFVRRRHADRVLDIDFSPARAAQPAPGVLESMRASDILVIGPSNPPLSVWPVLEIGGIRDAVASHERVVAVSPLISGRAVKGPAQSVMSSLGLPPGNEGVAAAYQGLVDLLVVDSSDWPDPSLVGLEVLATDIDIRQPHDALRLAKELVA